MRTTKIVMLLLCLTIVMVSMSGCTARTPLTPSEFTEIMEASNLTVYDITEQKDTSGFATAVITAVSQNFEIEYSELLNDQTGEMIYEYNKDAFVGEHPFQTLKFESGSGNYNCFYFQADGNFHIIARIGNTTLYCEAAEAYKSEILKLFESLGYK